jgi:hypothetical protein
MGITLNDRQNAVLRWVADGRPEGVMEGYAHRVSAAALRSQGSGAHLRTWADLARGDDRQGHAIAQARNLTAFRRSGTHLERVKEEEMAFQTSTVQQVFATVDGDDGYIWFDPPISAGWKRIRTGDQNGIANVLTLATTAWASGRKIGVDIDQNNNVVWAWLLQ